jgi:hypothetical protein
MKHLTRIPNPLLHWQSLVRDQRIRELRAAKQDPFMKNGLLYPSLLSQISGDVLMFVNATCAALGGAGRMTLAEWRVAEEQLKQKLEYEKRRTHQ